MKRALLSVAAAAAIAVGAIAASVTSAGAAPKGGGGGVHGGAGIGGGGGGGGGGRLSVRASGPVGGGLGGSPMRPSFKGAAMPPRVGMTGRTMRTAQVWSGNPGYWRHGRRHFRGGAFFGFAAGYPYGYGYDSCWAREIGPYGYVWVNLCDDYYYNYY